MSRLAQRTLALIASVFGVVTLVAGTRVLLGADPGYEVYRPLLLFNTAMGLAYVAAGVLAWTDARRGMVAAALVLLLNVAMLGWVLWLRAGGGPVAQQSVAAMLFRSAVWLVLWLGLAMVVRRRGKVPG